MPQWLLPYTAAFLLAAGVGALALSHDSGTPDSRPTPTSRTLAAGPGSAAQPVAAPVKTASDQPATPADDGPSSGVGVPVSPPSGTPEPNAALRRVVVEALGEEGNDSACTRLYTLAFLEQVHSEMGKAAVEECRTSNEADDELPPRGVDVRRMRVSHGRVSVRATMVGGSFGGSVMSLELLKVGGAWKIDRLVNVDFATGRLRTMMISDGLEEGYSRGEATCLANRFSELGEDRYERAIIEGRADSVGEYLGRSGIACLDAATLRSQFIKGIRAGASDSLPEPLIDCIVRKVIGGKSATQLRDLLRRGTSYRASLGREAAAICAQSIAAAGGAPAV